ncbi:MAG: TetR family transcriptional regulator [Rhodobacterales bacterium]|nr:TetR family transcriptional regulator [Rhodobacterales bacterium]
MARPRRHSDEALLDAALALLLRVGPQAFTLADAGSELGMTRPALIQRFGPREALLRAMSARQLDLTRAWLAGLGVPERSEAALRALLAQLAASVAAGQGHAGHPHLAAVEAADPALTAQAAARQTALRDALAQRIPRGLTLRPVRAADLLVTVIAGALQTAAADPATPVEVQLQARLDLALALLFPAGAD